MEDQPAGDPHGARAGGEDYHIESPVGLDSSGKDTALYLESGAVQVERLLHRRNGLAAGIEMALRRFPPAMSIVVESSGAVMFLDPVAVVMVTRLPMREMKASTERILPRVTDLLISSSTPATIEQLCAQFPALRPMHTWSADLVQEPPPPEMLSRLRTLLVPVSGRHDR